jgi:hypothetical protein
MADDQPIMETYKFIARSKESVISMPVVPPEPVPETTAASLDEKPTIAEELAGIRAGVAGQ